MDTARAAFVLTLLSLLVACGGGGGDGDEAGDSSDGDASEPISQPPGAPRVTPPLTPPDAPGLDPPQTDPPDDPPSDPDPPDDPPAGVTDVEIGDPLGRYVNIEFSPDMRHAAFIEQTDIAYEVWMSDVDRSDATLIPVDGRGHFITRSPLVGMGQWGEDALGQYLVVLDLDGHLVVARPQEDGAPLITVVTDDPHDEETRLARAFPFPSRNVAAAAPQIVYQLRTPETYALYLVELGNPLLHRLIHDEPGEGGGATPAAIVTFQRWLPDTDVFVHGTFEPCNTDPCLAQVQKVELTGGAPLSNLVTDDMSFKVDAFPFWGLDGNWYLLAGINYAGDGELFAYDATEDMFHPQRAVDLDAAQSDLGVPGGAQSFEPFVWEGEQYATYEVFDLTLATDRALAGEYPGEIWVVKLGASVVTCRVSVLDHPGDPLHPDKQARVDAEPLVVGDRVWLFYHAGPPVVGNDFAFDLRRIDLGDKAQFDQSCAAGTAAPSP